MAHKSVLEAFSDADTLSAHRGHWLQGLAAKQKVRTGSANYENDELSVLSTTEINIVHVLQVPEKFSRPDMSYQLESTIRVQNGNLSEFKARKHMLSFKSTVGWSMSTAGASVYYSERNDRVMAMDVAAISRMTSVTSDVAPGDFNNVMRSAIMDKCRRAADLRHLFCKGYLLLQDYSLGVTSKSKHLFVDRDLAVPLVANCEGLARLGHVKEHDIVVDCEMLTANETTLLGILGASYPSIKYTDSSVYNQIELAADDIVLVSSGQIRIKEGYRWGSPDTLYSLLISLAEKLNSTADLWAAFRLMRPLPFLMAKIVERSGQKNFVGPVPPSHSVEHAWGGLANTSRVPGAPSGYLSSSAALIADALLGEALHLGASLVLEELGLLGSIFDLSDLINNPIANGLCRDYGLTGSDANASILLNSWHCMLGYDIGLGFDASLRDYVLRLGDEIIAGNDVPIPALLQIIPMTATPNCSWGHMRGWQGSQPLLQGSDEHKLEQRAMSAMFGWLCGMRDRRADCGRSRAYGRSVQLTPDEFRFEVTKPGRWEVVGVGFCMVSHYELRKDALEMLGRGLERTKYKGVGVEVTFDGTSATILVTENVELEKQGRESMRHRSTVVTTGAAPSRVIRMPKPIHKSKVRIKAPGDGGSTAASTQSSEEMEDYEAIGVGLSSMGIDGPNFTSRDDATKWLTDHKVGLDVLDERGQQVETVDPTYAARVRIKQNKGGYTIV